MEESVICKSAGKRLSPWRCCGVEMERAATSPIIRNDPIVNPQWTRSEYRNYKILDTDSLMESRVRSLPVSDWLVNVLHVVLNVSQLQKH